MNPVNMTAADLAVYLLSIAIICIAVAVLLHVLIEGLKKVRARQKREREEARAEAESYQLDYERYANAEDWALIDAVELRR